MTRDIEDGEVIEGIATCPEDTRETLAAELRALGARNVALAYRAVTFEIDRAGFYRAHLWLRTASRILRVVANVPARSKDELYEEARRLPWPRYFRSDHGFRVEGVPGGRGAEGVHPLDIALPIRDAVQERFLDDEGRAPPVDLEEPKVVIVALVREGRCALSFDTCGKALHKRGYRADGHPSPMKETMAAALLLMAGYDGTTSLVDPMCGSGTLAIEGAMIAYGKAPQIHRKKGQLLLEWQRDFDHRLWRELQDSARAERRLEGGPAIVASDIEARFVALARENALRARVERHIELRVSDFEALEPPSSPGLLIANLPYGERMKGGDEPFFEKLGAILKHRWAGWRAALLVAEAAPYKALGLKPARRFTVMNGSIPCKLLVFELYAGSRREPKPA